MLNTDNLVVPFLVKIVIFILSGFFSPVVVAEQQSKALEKVTLQLKWKHQFQFAGYYAAKQQGYYAAAGLDVELKELVPGSPAVNEVIAGHAEYGVGDVGILHHFSKGEPVIALAAIFQHNPLIFISKQSSGIVSPYEMLGKRIMQQSAVAEDAPLRVMLSDAEIFESQYTSIPYNFSIQPLINDEIDVMSGYITNEPFAISQQGIPVNIIKPQNYGVDFYGDLLFTSQDEISNHRQRTQAFLDASLKGWQYALENTEQMVQLIKHQYQSESSLQQLRNEAVEIGKLILPDTIPIGQLKVKRLRHVADIYHRLNLIDKLTENELSRFIFADLKSFDFTEEEKQWLDAHPVIRLGIDSSFMPYEWLDQSGNHKGLAADYIRLIEKRLGVKFELVNNKQSWHEVLAAAKRGEVDMLSCLVKTPDREEFLDFSQPYLNSSAVIVSEQSTGYIGSLEKLNNKRVAIHKGHFTQELLRQNYPDIEIYSTKNIKEALAMVANGKAYAFVGDVTAASYIMQKEGFLNLVFSGATPYQSDFSFAVQKSQPVLSSIINKTLASIKPAEREAIYNKWRAFEVTEGIKVKVLIKYVLLIAILFSVFAYWVYLLRKSEQALKSSEKKLQLILDTVPECIKLTDTNGRLLQMNQAGLSMLGIKHSADIIGADVNEFLVEDYRELFSEMNRKVFQGEAGSMQFQIKVSQQDPVWVESYAVPFVDDAQNIVSALAVTRDISERRKNEEAEKLATLVFQHTSEGIMVLNAESHIVAINPAFIEITGYSLEEVEGKNPKILQSGVQNKEFYEGMWTAIEETGRWEGEIWNKRKNGELYAEHLIINTIYGDKGEVVQRVALFSDITDRKEAEKLMWNQANFDSLTGLPNRNMFIDRLSQAIKRSTRSNKTVALVFLDLDYFKEVNDTLGHDMGDLLLCQVSQRISDCIRDTDTVARLGGDEFVIILPEQDGFINIDRVVQNILKAMNQVFSLGHKQANISASIGIAMYPDDAINIDELIRSADQAMYASKANGRSQFSFFTENVQDKAHSRTRLIDDMHSALANHQFELYFQPIVELSSGKIHKAEALIRWNHPREGLLEPLSFVPLAEESGLMVGIGDWVFQQAARQTKAWQEQISADFQVSINRSHVQFTGLHNSAEWLKYLQEIDLKPESIAVEITESLLLEKPSKILHELLEYRDAGIQVSMDDFGTGYSSLSYLNKYDIDYLKVDDIFVRNLRPYSSDLVLSEAIIMMSHKLGLKVIAEGVESRQQQDLLLKAGCDYGQGYLYSKPLPAAEFEKLLKDNLLQPYRI